MLGHEQKDPKQGFTTQSKEIQQCQKRIKDLENIIEKLLQDKKEPDRRQESRDAPILKRQGSLTAFEVLQNQNQAPANDGSTDLTEAAETNEAVSKATVSMKREVSLSPIRKDNHWDVSQMSLKVSPSVDYSMIRSPQEQNDSYIQSLPKCRLFKPEGWMGGQNSIAQRPRSVGSSPLRLEVPFLQPESFESVPVENQLTWRMQSLPLGPSEDQRPSRWHQRSPRHQRPQIRVKMGPRQTVRVKPTSQAGSPAHQQASIMTVPIDLSHKGRHLFPRVCAHDNDRDARTTSFFSDPGEDEGLKQLKKGDAISLWEYLKFEVIGASTQRDSNNKPEQDIQNFIQVPKRLEPLLAFGVVICIDTFLYVVTFLPLRFVASLFLLIQHGILWCLGLLTGGENKSQANRRFHRSHLYDVMRFLTVIICLYVLQMMKMSILYHYIRGQGMLKLYVVIGMMEVTDKLMCSFGQDALDALYLSTRSRDKRILFHFVTVTLYALLHSCLLFVHVATLNVAVNSSDQALLTLLISNNFNELKGSVFKKFDKKNLFQMACSDIVERFKLGLFLLLIVLLNYCQGIRDAITRLLKKVALWVFGGEVLVDWIKHCFIIKFNGIDPLVYKEYATMLKMDLTSCRQDGVILDHTYAVTRRLGFAQIPLTCIFLRLVQTAGPSFYLNFQPNNAIMALICILTFLCLLAIKILTGILLQAHSFDSHVEEMRSPGHSKSPEPQLRAHNMGKLSMIERFTLWKGRIV